MLKIRYYYITALVCVAPSLAIADQSWLEGTWENDRQQNENAHPYLSEMEDDARKNFLDRFEGLVWKFDDTVFTATSPDLGSESTGSYAIRAVDDLSFEIYGTQPEDFRFLIKKNSKGFCATYVFEGEAIEGATQCFKKQ